MAPCCLAQNRRGPFADMGRSAAGAGTGHSGGGGAAGAGDGGTDTCDGARPSSRHRCSHPRVLAIFRDWLQVKRSLLFH